MGHLRAQASGVGGQGPKSVERLEGLRVDAGYMMETDELRKDVVLGLQSSQQDARINEATSTSTLVHGWDSIKNLNFYSLLALSTHKNVKCYPTVTKNTLNQ